MDEGREKGGEAVINATGNPYRDRAREKEEVTVIPRCNLSKVGNRRGGGVAGVRFLFCTPFS